MRNNVSDVLRRAERGERFTITVGGRPVAELVDSDVLIGFLSAGDAHHQDAVDWVRVSDPASAPPHPSSRR
ncbi:MAG: type II toxin-antitoxin system prevent-host-death family antitoxin [Solirubrobacterales bacterium]|nr:type II toxin-antitoxin system prevent-host-death family antitoxin [Solirubrobacterales bacterium]